MSKLTKKKLKKQLDGVQDRFAALVKDLKASGYICESVYAPFVHDYQKEKSDCDASIVILDSKDPQLKQLDQSVFDGLDEKWRFAAVDEGSCAFKFDCEPAINCDEWYEGHGQQKVFIGAGYDATDWQSSLIERDIEKELLEVDLSSELTGSELCKAMLARGDTRIMCEVYDDGNRNNLTHVIRAYSDDKFHTKANRWSYAIPINNQGEPLTAREVGL